MKRTLALLALSTLPACTSTRIDDHSFHHNDAPPARNITYSTTVIKHEALAPTTPPVPRPTFQQQDQEYIQYQQEPESPARQSSYFPPTYNRAHATYNNYADYVVSRYASPTYYNRPQPVYCRPQHPTYNSYRPSVSVQARFQP